jgi:ribosome maturation protein Sdo1
MSQLVRYKDSKNTFEVVTNPGSVRKFREGAIQWEKVLLTDTVFSNYKKGNIAKTGDLKKVFGTIDLKTCLQAIVNKGHLEVSESERKEDVERQRKALLTYLNKNYTDAGGLPHPISRLESVLPETKVRIDSVSKIPKLAEEVVRKLIGELVFKRIAVEHVLRVNLKYSKETVTVLGKFSNILTTKRDRDTDRVSYTISIAPLDVDPLLLSLNTVTGGDYEFS